MIDETQTGLRPETKRAHTAERALRELEREILELPEEQITPDNAGFIAGLLVGRIMERHYTEAYKITAVNEASNDSGNYWADRDREVSGKFQLGFNEASQGNYKSLKQLLNEEAELQQTMYRMQVKARTQGEPGSTQPNEQVKKLGEKLSIISDRIPLQGPPIKAPTPAWMEEPPPLREQLRQFEGVTER